MKMKRGKKHLKFCPCGLTTKIRSQIFLPQLENILSGSYKTQRKKLKKIDSCLVQFLADTSKGLLKTDIKLPEEIYPKIGQYKDLLIYLAKNHQV